MHWKDEKRRIRKRREAFVFSIVKSFWMPEFEDANFILDCLYFFRDEFRG